MTEHARGYCCDTLYIYYIDGIALEGGFSGEKSFIGNWVEDGFSFLFFTEKNDRLVEGLLNSQENLRLIDSYSMTYEEWLGELPAAKKLGRFSVAPPWDLPDSFSLPDFGGSNIVLDPGVVFGTGTHPTTHDCLKFLEKAVKTEKTESVLDLGTGTGLLALAAGKLKCRKILALDFNHLAVKTTLKNVRLNDMEDRIISVQGRAEDFVNISADLLIANIHYDVMKEIITSPGFIEKKQFILSGLLKSQAEAIEKKLAGLPVKILEKKSRNGIWFTFFGRHNTRFTM